MQDVPAAFLRRKAEKKPLFDNLLKILKLNSKVHFDGFDFFAYNKYMSQTELSKGFRIGEDVFYPSTGLCSVVRKEVRNGRSYLKLTSLSQDSIILLPEDNAASLGLRHLTTKDDLLAAFAVLREDEGAEDKEWKHRVEKNTALLREGTVLSICRVVSSLYRRSKVKELPSVEKKLYDSAVLMLVDEASSVLKKSEEEVRKLIFSYLEGIEGV